MTKQEIIFKLQLIFAKLLDCTYNEKTKRFDCIYNVYLSPKKFGYLTKLPIPFGKIEGDFYCYNLSLTTLKNAPTWVEDSFLCYHNNLTSLEHAPKYVGGTFDCKGNGSKKLQNLYGIRCKNLLINRDNYI